MARISRLLAPLMVLTLLLSSAAVMLPTQQVLAATPDWSIHINATTTGEGSNNLLEFGTQAGSVDGYDGGAPDVLGSPPAPNSIDAYFPLNDPAYPLLSSLWGDYRDTLSTQPNSSIVWTLKVTTPSQPFTLTWTSIPGYAAFPVDASIILSGAGQTIDMRATNFAIFTGGALRTLTITLTRLAQPDEVWVDDDGYSGIDGTYEGMEGGTALIFGYNAFDNIQDGVDAVGDSTVNVLEGHYSAFNITEEDGIEVIGENGAVVDNTPLDIDGYALCLIERSSNILISNLEFNGAAGLPHSGDDIAGVVMHRRRGRHAGISGNP